MGLVFDIALNPAAGGRLRPQFLQLRSQSYTDMVGPGTYTTPRFGTPRQTPQQDSRAFSGDLRLERRRVTKANASRLTQPAVSVGRPSKSQLHATEKSGAKSGE